MGLRKLIGDKVEAVLNDMVDKIDADGIKAKLHQEIDELVDKHLADLKEKLKEGIDKIDGEDDLQPETK